MKRALVSIAALFGIATQVLAAGDSGNYTTSENIATINEGTAVVKTVDTDGIISAARNGVLTSESDPVWTADKAKYVQFTDTAFTTATNKAATAVQTVSKASGAATELTVTQNGTAVTVGLNLSAYAKSADVASDDRVDALEGQTNTWNTAATKAATAVQPGDLAAVAISGSYSDLSNKPKIEDLDTAFSDGSMFKADNKGGITLAVPGTDYVAPSALATVATSGSYNDLSNKPTIPTVYTGKAKASGLYKITVDNQGFVTNAVLIDLSAIAIDANSDNHYNLAEVHDALQALLTALQ